MTDIKYSLGLPDSLNPQIVQTLFYTTKNTSIYKPKATKLTGGGEMKAQHIQQYLQIDFLYINLVTLLPKYIIMYIF